MNGAGHRLRRIGVCPEPASPGGHRERRAHARDGTCERTVQIELHRERGRLPHVGDVDRDIRRGDGGREQVVQHAELREAELPSVVVLLVAQVAARVRADGQIGGTAAGIGIAFEDKFHRHIPRVRAEVEGRLVRAREDGRCGQLRQGDDPASRISRDGRVIATQRRPCRCQRERRQTNGQSEGANQILQDPGGADGIEFHGLRNKHDRASAESNAVIETIRCVANRTVPCASHIAR